MKEPLPAALYQGSANTWECDEMGHLNVRFHVQRALDGLAAFALESAMPRAFARDAAATIVPREAHVRFLREALPGAPLAMRGGVAAFDATGADIYEELRHIDGAVSSAFRLSVSHAEARTLRPFAWSARTRDAFGALTCTVPPHGQARGIDLKQRPADASRARAIALGAPVTARSVVGAHECDVFGRMRGEMFIARVSDAVPFLLFDWRKEAAEAANATGGDAKRPGGAAVEFRIVFRRWPQAGDHLEVRSAVTEVMEKANRLVHWILDPVSGQAWASVEAVALTFDLNSRKSYAPPPAMRAALAARALPEMRV